MSQRLVIVDYLKGFSITTIVLMHLMQFKTGLNIFDKALSFGGAGVHVFILCSGFGLYLSHLNKRLSFPLFLQRRFIKVYFPYALVILLSSILPFFCSEQDKLMCMLSHILLFKMFCEQYECSLGMQMWFVSTIIQFYLCWPLIVRCFEKLSERSQKLPLFVGLLISLIWIIVVVLLDNVEMRIWNSFFLQYLWEFVLGMCLAKKYMSDHQTFAIPSFAKLLVIACICIGMTGYAGFTGGELKMFNDVPSLFGYLSVALIIYKLKFVNSFFVFTSKFSYEWYLVHILVFECIVYVMSLFASDIMCCQLFVWIGQLIMSYIIGYIYNVFITKLNLSKLMI